MWDVVNAADTSEVRERKTNEKPQSWSVLGPLPDGLAEGKAMGNRGHCLAELRHGGV